MLDPVQLKLFLQGMLTTGYQRGIVKLNNNSDWIMRQIERQILPPYYFYWYRIDIKHMTEP